MVVVGNTARLRYGKIAPEHCPTNVPKRHNFRHNSGLCCQRTNKRGSGQMSGQQNNFAERLKRIEAKQGARPARQPTLDDVPSPRLDGGGGGGGDGGAPQGGGGSGFGPGRMALILLVILGIFGAGGFYIVNNFEKTPGGKLETAGAKPAAPQAEEISTDGLPPILALKIARPELDPDTPPSALADRGWVMQPGLVANAARAEVLVDQIASGYDPSRPDPVPGKVEMFDPNPECTLRTPRSDEILHNVRLETGTGPTDIHVVSEAQMGAALMKHIEGVTAHNKVYQIGKTANGRMRRVDVFVTDTAGPVYLVLQSMGGNTLWNIHRGPGVTISHVAMVGYTSGAILPGDIELEAIRVPDFVGQDEFGANDQIRPCMVRPYRAPEPHWPGQQKANENNTLYVNQMHSFSTGFRAFNAWFTGATGQDANTNLVAAQGAAHVLVGPVPAGQLGYNRIEGRTLNLVRTDRVYNGDVELYEAHLALLTLAVGGDPLSLDPAPMERATQ